jgi:hypothetical protein
MMAVWGILAPIGGPPHPAPPGPARPGRVYDGISLMIPRQAYHATQCMVQGHRYYRDFVYNAYHVDIWAHIRCWNIPISDHNDIMPISHNVPILSMSRNLISHAAALGCRLDNYPNV